MSSRETAKGIFWMVAAEFVFVACWCAIKFLGGRLPLFEIVFFRAAISLVILIPLTYVRLKSFRIYNYRSIFVRSFFGFIGMFSSFYAMIHLNMGNASTLINTMPIFVAIFSPLLATEPFVRKQFFFVVIAFVGIAFILKPDLGLLDQSAISGLVSGLTTGIAMIGLRKLHATDNTMIITLYFTAFSALASLPFAIPHFIMPTKYEFAWLLVLGIIISFAQLFMTKSYQYGNAATIAPFAYSSVIMAYIAGLIFFAEVPDLWSVIGTVIIIASGIGVMLTAPRARNREEENSTIASFESTSS